MPPGMKQPWDLAIGEVVRRHAAAARRPTTMSHRRLQPASPVLPADASPCSTVLPEMVRLPPVAWVISTRRG